MKKAIALAIFVALVAAGCKEKATLTVTTDDAPAATELTPEQLGELGAAIRKQPDQAQKMLSERGLTEETFEQAIRRVTENPDSSKRYTEAYKKAS